ncbi:MAG: hypothetical protein K6F68_05470 [Clostridiales bacterium]|nr:hypothetical protein [Clostridiales bacterium]
MNLLEALALSLLLTEIIELPVCFLLGFRGRELIIVLLANIATNPALVFLLHILTAAAGFPRWAVTLVLELSAFMIEALIYRRATDRRIPMLDSFIANAASFSAGLLITTFLL